MATPRVRADVGNSWKNVIGAATGMTGVIWQNVGEVPILIAFTAAAPQNNGTDAYNLLMPGDAFTDSSGSTTCWVKTQGSARSAITAVTA